MSAYRRLPRWARWAIPVVVVLVIVGAASSSSSKKGHRAATSASAARAGKSGVSAGWARAEAEGVREAPVRARYRARADALCARLERRYKPQEARLAALIERVGGEELTAKQEAAVALRYWATLKKAAAGEFKALTPPPADREEISKIVSARDEAAKSLEDMADFVEHGDREGVELAKRTLAEATAQYRGLAHRYGLKICG